MNLEEIDNLKRLLKSQEIEDIELLFDILDTNKRIKARILRKFSKFYNKGRKYKIRAYNITCKQYCRRVGIHRRISPQIKEKPYYDPVLGFGMVLKNPYNIHIKDLGTLS